MSLPTLKKRKTSSRKKLLAKTQMTKSKTLNSNVKVSRLVLKTKRQPGLSFLIPKLSILSMSEWLFGLDFSLENP